MSKFILYELNDLSLLLDCHKYILKCADSGIYFDNFNEFNQFKYWIVSNNTSDISLYNIIFEKNINKRDIKKHILETYPELFL